MIAIAALSTSIDHTFSTYTFALPPILAALPPRVLETMTGNMLGDGGIGYPNMSRDRVARGNARYGMTMSTAGYPYMLELFTNIYALYSSSGLRP